MNRHTYIYIEREREGPTCMSFGCLRDCLVEIVDWMKSLGLKHSWFGAAAAGDYMRLKEFLDNGQESISFYRVQ